MSKPSYEHIKIIDAHVDTIDFRPSVREALELPSDFNLADLHTIHPARTVVEKSNDSTSEIHKLYYRNIGKTGFNAAYRDFLNTVVAPELADHDLVVQRIPSFRIHRPGDRAVGEYHRDGDIGYNHQAGVVNFWVPLTDTYDTNSLHIQTDGDRVSYPLSYGQALVFDAVSLFHGNELNQTTHTRVSFDTRVIRRSDYIPSNAKSANTKTPLRLGGYYAKLSEI